jgi:hypothetical protein
VTVPTERGVLLARRAVRREEREPGFDVAAPGPPTMQAIAALQRDAGNRAVTQLLQRRSACSCGGSCTTCADQSENEGPAVGLLPPLQRKCGTNPITKGPKWMAEYDGCSLPHKAAIAAGAVSLGGGALGTGALLSAFPFWSGRPGQEPGVRLGLGAGSGTREGFTAVGSAAYQGASWEGGGFGGYSAKRGAFGGAGWSAPLGPGRLSAGADWSQKEGAGGRLGWMGGKDWWRLGAEARASERGGWSATAGASFAFDLGGGSGPTVTHPKSRAVLEQRGEREEPTSDLPMPGGSMLPGGTHSSTNVAGATKDNPAGGSDTAFAKWTSTSTGGDACDRHDECYQTCGSDRSVCDARMYDDMVRICNATADGPHVKGTCLHYAKVYYEGLKALGGPAHEKRQSAVCGCEDKDKTGAVRVRP